MPAPLLPPPIFSSITVLVSVLFSSSANFGKMRSRSSLYFCGQWQASQVSRAGRRLCTGLGIGREYVFNITANTCRTPDSLLRTNHDAPGPMWQCTHSSRECGEFLNAVNSGCITVWHVWPQKLTESM